MGGDGAGFSPFGGGADFGGAGFSSFFGMATVLWLAWSNLNRCRVPVYSADPAAARWPDLGYFPHFIAKCGTGSAACCFGISPAQPTGNKGVLARPAKLVAQARRWRMGQVLDFHASAQGSVAGRFRCRVASRVRSCGFRATRRLELSAASEIRFATGPTIAPE